MFAEENTNVAFQLKTYLLSAIIDWFGAVVEFFEESCDEVTARVKVNLSAMSICAIQYALRTRILSPQSLAGKVKEDVENTHKIIKI